LVALTALAVITTTAYMAGKSTVPAHVEAVKPKTVEAVIPPPAVKAPPLPEAPLFATPERTHRYIQLGSVDRGFAILMVHGARKVGYPAFIASGASPNVHRVLVGPMDDKVQYETAKAMFASMGLDMFARKYGESPEPAEKTETPAP
jgi:cell division septation protein DedD